MIIIDDHPALFIFRRVFKNRAAMTSKSAPTYDLESQANKENFRFVAGVDEVGRGPLAGPVVAAAVILSETSIPVGLNDSKKLTERKREILFQDICATSHVGLAALSAKTIDQLNIREATLTAMVQAVRALDIRPDYVLIDGRDIPANLDVPAQAVIKGDSQSLSIAAASIVAKVARDTMMKCADQRYPGYNFSSHKGYGSEFHRNQIARLGPCPLHRRSFEPVKSMKI